MTRLTKEGPAANSGVALQVICNGEEVLTVSGTKEKYVVDVWSGNHPFFNVRRPASPFVLHNRPALPPLS